MRFFRLAPASIALLAALSASPVRADPLILSINGTAFGVPVHETIDVTGGFSGLTIPLTDTPLAVLTGHGDPAPGISEPINSSFFLFAGLTGLSGTKLGANEILSGTIQGSYRHLVGNPNLDGWAGGWGAAGNLVPSPGASAAMVPSWFTGLSATVTGQVSGGGENLLKSSLLLTPGPSAGAASVPEPSSVVAFAVTLIGLAVHHRLTRRG